MNKSFSPTRINQKRRYWQYSSQTRLMPVAELMIDVMADEDTLLVVEIAI